MAVATNGNVGSPTLTREEIAAVRKEEALAASRRLGAKGFLWLDEDDEFLLESREVRLKFVDVIREAKADIIVTHNPQDYHPDHVACSKLATDARILSAVRLIETPHPCLAQAPELFYMDSVAGINFLPQFYVDISEAFSVKMEALGCHDSQNAWLKDIFNQELMDVARIQAAFRGLQIGVSHAEAFIQPTYWPRSAISLPELRQT